MLDNESKRKALQEYFRVLKPGGYLLTHDLILKQAKKEEDQNIHQSCSAINVHATPLSEQNRNGMRF